MPCQYHTNTSIMHYLQAGWVCWPVDHLRLAAPVSGFELLDFMFTWCSARETILDILGSFPKFWYT